MTHLKELGTVAFDLPVMRKLIGVGGLEQDATGYLYIVRDLDPKTIQCGPWLQIVPPAYQDAARSALSKIQSEYLCRPLTDRLLEQFIEHLQHESLATVELFAERERAYRRRYAEAERDAAQKADEWFGVDLGDLGEVAGEIHHMIEGGQLDCYAIELLRRCIRHHGGRTPRAG